MVCAFYYSKIIMKSDSVNINRITNQITDKPIDDLLYICWIQNKIDGIIGGSEHFAKELPIQEVIEYANQKLRTNTH